MARTIITLPYYVSYNEVINNLELFLLKKGFKKIVTNNEEVWKKGTGMLTAMQFLKFQFTENREVMISGWVQAGLGSVGFNEMDLSGTVAAIPKRSLLKTIDELKSCLH